MFTIIISEKGGAERREAFDRNEINVGRVQGNDLMLPKGNVSKHHARLLYRDGRFIVTDLKSTNGTYVNGRKISQATIVREGDKIYIGDFVLRLETAQAHSSADGDNPQPRSDARSAPDAREIGALSPPPQGLPSGGPLSPGVVKAAPSAPATPAQRGADSSVVSHFPIDRDPESDSAPEPKASPPSRVPSPPRLPPGDGRGRANATVAMPAPISNPRAAPRATPQQSARRTALVALIDRIGNIIDLSELTGSPAIEESLARRIQTAVREQSKSIQSEGIEVVDGEALARDAVGELLAVGPLGSLLDDEQVEEIIVPRADLVIAVRNGQGSLADVAFSGEPALARAVARLAHDAGEPLRPGETLIDRRLSRGARMVAIAPPLAAAWTLSIRKQVRAEASLDEFVRSGVLSRPMATLLERCVGARANVLVVGPGTGLVVPMLAALSFASGPGERIALLADTDDIHVAHAHVIRLGITSRGARLEEILWAAARLRPDRLVVASLAGPLVAAVIDAVSEGTDGVVAGCSAPSLRQGLGRLVGQVALSRPGCPMESARAAVAECFDIVVEMTRSADGRSRVTRLAELAGADGSGVVVNDLFVPTADGTGEGGYAATGTTPRFAREFARRGLPLDPALFRRRQ